jgi:WhiB family redox-sensing transcriptional regulator
MYATEKDYLIDRALKICEKCDVRVHCLEYALKHNIQFGVWGGMTERQRLKERRRRLRLTRETG